MRLFRLGAAGARLVDELAAGAPVPRSGPRAALVDRFLDAGVLHPIPPVDGPWRAADVTVVIPVLDPEPDALASLVRAVLDGGVAGVVVVDDGGAVPLGPVPGATVVRRAVNGGPGAARGTGLHAVTTPLVAFVDADVAVASGWLDGLLGHFADPTVALVAPRVACAATPGRRGRYEVRHSPLDLGAVPARIRAGTRVSYVPTAAVVVRRDALDAVGGFDPGLRTGEDVDLVWRLDEAGYRCRYEPTVVVRHSPRSSWRSWLGQRAGYGRSAGPLARRHPGALAPVAVSGWSAAAWSLAVLGPIPVGAAAGGAVATATAAALHRKVGSWRLVVSLAGRGHLHAGRQLAAAVRRAWWPVLLPAAMVSRPVRRVVALAVLVGLREGGPLRVVDDAAYAVGVWHGAWRARTIAPLVPDLTSWPAPSRYERRRADGSDRHSRRTPPRESRPGA